VLVLDLALVLGGAAIASAWPLVSAGHGSVSQRPSCTVAIRGLSYSARDCKAVDCSKGHGTWQCDQVCTATGWVSGLCVSSAGVVSLNPTTTTTTAAPTTTVTTTSSTTTTT